MRGEANAARGVGESLLREALDQVRLGDDPYSIALVKQRLGPYDRQRGQVAQAAEGNCGNGKSSSRSRGECRTRFCGLCS